LEGKNLGKENFIQTTFKQHSNIIQTNHYYSNKNYPTI